MRLDRLAFKGLTCFLEPVEIDFSSLPSGLIAVTGENGSGKTTILDACLAALYRKMPSRSGRALVDYVHGKDAYVKLQFLSNGGRYASVLSLDAELRKSDAVLSEFKHDWNELNDGKVSTFDAAVETLFPPYSVMLASAFAAQNRTGSFLTLDRPGRKSLFASLLGIEHYDRYALVARERAAAADQKRIQAGTILQDLETSIPQREGEYAILGNKLQDELLDVTAQHERLDEDGRLLQDVFDTIQATVTKTAEDARLFVRLEEEADDKGRQVGTLLEELSGIQPGPTDEGITQEYDADVVALGHWLKHRQEQVDADLAEVGLITGQEEDIRAADTWANTLDTEHESLEARWDAQCASHSEALRTLAAIQDEVRLLAASEETLARFRESSALVDEAACEGKAPYDKCILLETALKHRRGIPEMEKEVERLAEARKKEKFADAAARMAQQDIENTAADMARLANEAKELREGNISVVVLDQALQKQRELHQARKDLLADFADREVLLKETRDHRLHAAQATRDAIELRRTNLKTQADALTQQIADLRQRAEAVSEAESEHKEALAALSEAKNKIEAHEALVFDIVATRARLTAEGAALDADREQLQRDILKRDTLRKEEDSWLSESFEWGVLARAFGRDGLPVLEIDAAGPAVSDLCNDLLQSCFGSSRFTVELVTQQPKTDGTGMKEIFELKVYDSERDGERDLTDLSGGEQVIVDEALKSAIALFVNQQNTFPMQTCWRDETTGALDPENALRYIALLRRLRERGGYEQVIFVSHNPDATALADAHLAVAAGAVTVRYPPFA